MDHVYQGKSAGAAGARQRWDAKYLAHAALALFVTFDLACLVTGCSTQEHRADHPEGDAAPHLVDSGMAALQRQDSTDVLAGSHAVTALGTSPPVATLARDWLLPARDFSPAAHAPIASGQGDDVWARLRQGFQLDDRGHLRIEKAAAVYRDKPEVWVRIEDRARRFLPLIVKEVEQRQLPLELALIPVIESTFDPTAVSPGKAAGLWQIIPSTAKTLGLQRNGHYDGRRDVLAATGAALDYLQTLAAEFGGDWELALASYNAGSGAVRRAIARNRENGKPTDYWSLALPAEAEGYVPRLLAVARVVKHPRSFGVQLADLPAEPEVTPVQVAEQIDLSLAANLAQMSIGELKDLNPGLISTRSLVPIQQTLLVPVEKAPALLAELEKRSGQSTTPASTPAPAANAERPERGIAAQADATHVVGKGDSLWAVARKHSVEVADLARANGIRPDSPLREGQLLTVPTGAPRTSKVVSEGFEGEG
jgi:membrane-bound lytic murein transglycosylase D